MHQKIFILKWNLIPQSHLFCSLSDVLSENSSLVSDDKIPFQANKYVLSTVLKNILPLIDTNTKSWSQSCSLSTLHLGEALFYQSNMDRFIKTAGGNIYNSLFAQEDTTDDRDDTSTMILTRTIMHTVKIMLSLKMTKEVSRVLLMKLLTIIFQHTTLVMMN